MARVVLKKWHEQDILDWCVGRNPPSVVCGIRLIGLPAPWVDSASASVCPFHLQDGRFTASQLAHSASPTPHSPVQLDVSFLLRCQRSRVAPTTRLQFYTWAEFPQTQHFLGPKATHQLASPKRKSRAKPIRISPGLNQFAFGHEKNLPSDLHLRARTFRLKQKH